MCVSHGISSLDVLQKILRLFDSSLTRRWKKVAGMVPCAEAPLPRICFEFIHPPRSSLINHSKARQVGVPKHAIVCTAPGYVSIIRRYHYLKIARWTHTAASVQSPLMVQRRSPLYGASHILHHKAREVLCEPHYHSEQYRTITLHMNTCQLQ